MNKENKPKPPLTQIINDSRNPEGVIGNHDIFQMLQKITNGDLNNKVMSKEEDNDDDFVLEPCEKQERLTAEEYLEIIRENPSEYRNIPYSMITQDIVDIALKYNPYLLKYTPKEFKTKELCTYCVFKNYELIEYVPNDLDNYFHLCKIVVGRDWYAFHYIKLDEIPTSWYLELLKYSVTQDYKTLLYVDTKIDEYENYEDSYFQLCKEVLDKNINGIRYISYSYKRYFELCEYALKIDKNTIYLISEEYNRYNELLTK
jgi:hypothetical protein